MTRSRASVALAVEASPQIRFLKEIWKDMSSWGRGAAPKKCELVK